MSEPIADGTDAAARALRGVRAALAQRDDLVLIDPSPADLLRTAEQVPHLVELLRAVASLLSPHLHAVRQRRELELDQDQALGKVVVALDGLCPVLEVDAAWQCATLLSQPQLIRFAGGRSR